MSTEVLHITIPTELANRIRDRVRSGEYASESDVIIHQFSHEDDPADSLSPEELEEAVAILDEMERHPETVLTHEQFWADFEAQHAAKASRAA